MIVIGTSGYYYRDWVGNFYPDKTKKEEMLALYARHFPAVELNFTYYGIPKPSTFENMLSQTPANFEFIVKANREMTHGVESHRPERRQRRNMGHGDTETQRKNGIIERNNLCASVPLWQKELFSTNSPDSAVAEDVFAKYRDAIAPLVESGRLGGILAQFPGSFNNTPDNRNYLYYLRENLPQLPLIVEFRSDSWQKQEVFDFLKEHHISYCCVDEPQLRGLPDRRALFTAEPAYIRFHSRDAGRWYGGDRYNYLYKKEELKEWIPKLRELAQASQKLYVFFNNCHGAQAAQNARMLGELLEFW